MTMPFMLTYAAVDYAYFCLAMSYDKKRAREARFETSNLLKHSQSNGIHSKSTTSPQEKSNVSTSQTLINQGAMYGATGKRNNDLDNLFPERNDDGGPQQARKPALDSPTFVKPEHKSETTDDTAELINKQPSAGICQCLIVISIFKKKNPKF